MNNIFNYKKHTDIDPFNEEDWTEFELKNTNVIYFFGSDINNTPFVGCSIIDNNSLKIKKCSNKSLIDTNKIIDEQYIRELNKKQFVTTNININKNIIYCLVCDFKSSDNYNTIHNIIRKKLYDVVENKHKEIQKLNEDLNQKENDVIVLKSKLKNRMNYPKLDDIKLESDEYIIIKNWFNINKEDDFYITKLSEQTKKGGYHFISDENKKVCFVDKTIDKLLKNKYLFLHSTEKKTYITNDIKIYNEIIKKLIVLNNSDINSKIEEKRKSYKDILNEINVKTINLESIREKYYDFNFEKLYKLIETL
jgi:hypothetical protein